MSKTSRRSFLGNTGKAALAATAIFNVANPFQEKQMKNVFIHHVYFWLNDPENLADRNKLIEGLTRLSKVKTIRQFHIGRPADTSRSVIENSYAISWFVLFDNATDQAAYQTDPIHLKFIKDCESLWKKVIVYDAVDA
jgi:hypothetical protein